MTIRTLFVVAVSCAILCGACPPTGADPIWPDFILEGRKVRLSSIEVEQVLLLACTRETDRIREFRDAYRHLVDDRPYINAYVRCHEESGPYGMPLVYEVTCTRTSGMWACGSRGPEYHKAQVGNAFVLIDLVHPLNDFSHEPAPDPHEAQEVMTTLLRTRWFKGEQVSRTINGSRCEIRRTDWFKDKPSDDVWYVRCGDNGYHLREICADDECSYQLLDRHDSHGKFYE